MFEDASCHVVIKAFGVIFDAVQVDQLIVDKSNLSVELFAQLLQFLRGMFGFPFMELFDRAV